MKFSEPLQESKPRLVVKMQLLRSIFLPILPVKGKIGCTSCKSRLLLKLSRCGVSDRHYNYVKDFYWNASIYEWTKDVVYGKIYWICTLN